MSLSLPFAARGVGGLGRALNQSGYAKEFFHITGSIAAVTFVALGIWALTDWKKEKAPGSETFLTLGPFSFLLAFTGLYIGKYGIKSFGLLTIFLSLFGGAAYYAFRAVKGGAKLSKFECCAVSLNLIALAGILYFLFKSMRLL